MKSEGTGTPRRHPSWPSLQKGTVAEGAWRDKDLNRTTCPVCGFGVPGDVSLDRGSVSWCLMLGAAAGPGTWREGFKGRGWAQRAWSRRHLRGPLGIPEITGSDSEGPQVRSGQRGHPAYETRDGIVNGVRTREVLDAN